MDDYSYFSQDKRFGLKLTKSLANEMFDFCLNDKSHETGGILIGHYTSDQSCAIVNLVKGPTSDSKSGRTWFYRGTKDLQVFLERLWRTNKNHYLGEWHYHPGGSPIPSVEDRMQMTQIANSKRYNCPEPILIIIGGQLEIGAYVFPKGYDYAKLKGENTQVRGNNGV